MIDKLIQKQVEEFRKEFTEEEGFGGIGGVGTRMVFKLSDNPDYSHEILIDEIEAHLVRSMKMVGEEIVKKIEKELKLYPTKHENYWTEVHFDDWNKLKVSLTDKGE